VGELPKLPFADKTFDLALCSHFLFLYSAQFDYLFHLNAIKEMLRVAERVRIFPLLDLMSVKSAHLTQIVTDLQTDGYDIKIMPCAYELQPGGNEMLSIQAGG
jgi:ubiquinone/menaquinone biosynthesis C-methylase UbiE